jgi:hypothetical protein
MHGRSTTLRNRRGRALPCKTIPAPPASVNEAVDPHDPQPLPSCPLTVAVDLALRLPVRPPPSPARRSAQARDRVAPPQERGRPDWLHAPWQRAPLRERHLGVGALAATDPERARRLRGQAGPRPRVRGVRGSRASGARCVVSDPWSYERTRDGQEIINQHLLRGPRPVCARYSLGSWRSCICRVSTGE